MTELFTDGTLIFLPGRLNNQPVIMGGLTADEMWTTLLFSIVAGLQRTRRRHRSRRDT